MSSSDPKILHLTLKKKYFEQIKTGEKTSEYRLYKPYWKIRLMNKDGSFKHFDLVLFRNGYNADAPKMLVEIVKVRVIKEKIFLYWYRKYFEIVLGKILETS